MAIGAHELLLIVRAQNQASALLGRVGRDFRRLQAMKSLDIQRSRTVNQMAANALQMQAKMAKIQSTIAVNGKTRLQHEQAVARNQLQQLNIGNRITNLEMRRTSVARAEAGLEVQRLRLLQQEANLERNLEKIELRRMGIQNQIGRYGTQLMAGRQQGEKLRISQMNAEAQVLERQVALNKLNSQYMKSVRKGGAVAGSNIALQRQAAQLRLSASQATVATFPGQRALLAERMGGIQADAAKAAKSLELLKGEEARLAETAGITTVRHAQLAEALANVQARGTAVAGAEAELNAQLAITKDELGIVNAAWIQNLKATEAATASLQVNIEQERILAGTLRDVDAAMALQKGERFTTMARGVSHVGRVLQATGLIGVAVFGAMGIAAAHLNQEATRAATQTGSIGSNANQVVANAAKIEKAITGIMQTIPANSHELTDTLYNIYSSMNATFGQGTQLLKLFGQVWVAGGMVGNVKDVSDALITLGNNWHVAAGDMNGWRKLANSTLATVRFARLDVEKYTQTMNQLAPAFHGAHQSIEEMNGAIAFLTKILPSANVSSAGIARMMEQLQRFAANPKPGFEKMARDITTVSGNLKPLHEILPIIVKDMADAGIDISKSGLALNNFFKTVSGTQGTVQARRALQGFVLNQKDYQRTLQQTTGDQKEFNRSLKAMEQSTGVKWAMFVNQMRALALELGSAVVPGLLAAAKPLQNLAHWFNSLDDSTKKTIGHWLALVAVGLLIGGTVATIVGGMALFYTSLKTVGVAMGIIEKDGAKAATSVGKLSSEVGAISPKLAITLAKATALGAAFFLIQSQTHDLGKTLHYFGYVILAGLIIKLVQLTVKLRAARNMMIGLQAATFPEIAALVLISYELAKLVDRIPGLDTAIRNLFQGTDHTVDTTREHIRQLKIELEQVHGFAREDIQAKIDTAEAMNSVKKLQDMFRGKPDWATAHIHVILDPTELAKVQQQINKIVQTLQPMPGTTDIAIPRATMEARLAAMFPFLDAKTIDKMTKQAYKSLTRAQSQFTEASRQANFGAIPRGVTGQTTAALTDAEFQKATQRAAELNRAKDAATTPQGYEQAWLAYENYVTKLTQDMTKQQKALFQDLLNFILSKTNLAATVSDATIIQMTQRAEELHNAFLKSPTTKNWRAWQAELAKITKLGTQNQITEANDVLSANKDITDKGIQAAKDAADKRKQIEKDQADKILKIQKDTADKQKQIQQTAQQNIKSGTQNIMSIYQDALKQYQGYIGTIFQGPFMQGSIVQTRQQFGFSARPGDFVRDMKMGVTQAEGFQKSLDRLRKRGAPSELVQQIAALGPEAQKQLDVIGMMSGAQFKEWVGYFKRGQQDAKVQAKKDLDARLKEWMRFGKSVALAIATGIKSEDVALENAMRSLFEKMFPGTKLRAAGRGGHETVLPGAHPGMTHAGNIDILNRKIAHVGDQIATVRSITVGFGKKFVLLPTIINGMAVSNKKAIENYRRTGQNLGIFSSEAAADKYAARLHRQQEKYYGRGRINLPSTVGDTVHYNVYAGHGEGWESALRRAHFKQKNRKK